MTEVLGANLTRHIFLGVFLHIFNNCSHAGLQKAKVLANANGFDVENTKEMSGNFPLH